MTLEEFIAETTKIMGKPKHVSPKLVEDYPEYTAVEPLQEPAEHKPYTAYKAWWVR